MTRRAVVVVLAVLACSGRAAAHSGGGGPHAWLGPAGFLVGVAVAGAAVVLDARDAVAPRYADVGVFAGVAVALAGLAAYVVV